MAFFVLPVLLEGCWQQFLDEQTALVSQIQKKLLPHNLDRSVVRCTGKHCVGVTVTKFAVEGRISVLNTSLTMSDIAFPIMVIREQKTFLFFRLATKRTECTTDPIENLRIAV